MTMSARQERIAELRRKHFPEPEPEPKNVPWFSTDMKLISGVRDQTLFGFDGSGTAGLRLAGDEMVLYDFDGTELARASAPRDEWISVRYDRKELIVEPMWVRAIGPQTLKIDQFIIARVFEFAPAMLSTVQAVLKWHGPLWMTWTPGPVCGCCLGEGEPTHQMSFGTFLVRDNGETESTFDIGPWWLPHADYPCNTTRLFASQWADHPAFRDEWRADATGGEQD